MSTSTRKTNPGSAARRQMAAQSNAPGWLNWAALLGAAIILVAAVFFALSQKDLVAVVNGEKVTGEAIRKLASLYYVTDPISTDLTQESVYNQASYYAIMNQIRSQEARARNVTEITYEDNLELQAMLSDVELSHLIAAGYESDIDFDYAALFYGYSEPNVSDQAYLESLVGSSAREIYLEALNSLSLTEADVSEYLTEALIMSKLDSTINEEAGATVTEEDLMAYYEVHKAEKFIKYDISHILRKTSDETDEGEVITFTEEQIQDARDIINQVYQQAVAGDDFAALATQFSEDPGSASQEGSLGEYTHEQIISGFVTPFNTAAAALTQVGEISDVIQTEFGFHVIRLNGINEQTFEEVEDTINSTLTTERADKLKLTIVEKYTIQPADLQTSILTQAQATSRGW